MDSYFVIPCFFWYERLIYCLFVYLLAYLVVCLVVIVVVVELYCLDVSFVIFNKNRAALIQRFFRFSTSFIHFSIGTDMYTVKIPT